MDPATDPKQILKELFPDHPHLASTLELIWRQATRCFPGSTMQAWLHACREMAESELGEACTLAYLRNAPACAAYVGPEAAASLARAAFDIGVLTDERAVLAFLAAAPKAARRLGILRAFLEWIRIIQQFAALAPESASMLLDRTEGILADLDLRAYEAWARSGLRATANDPDRRLKFFSLLDPTAQRWLMHDADGPVFSDVERRLKAYLAALWRLWPPIRPAAPRGAEPPRRASFEGGIIRIPDAFRGVSGNQTITLFRAALAHIAAHLVFTRRKFQVGSLKPVQVALVSLIEDARVEEMSIRAFPGLRRLWAPFHIAEPTDVLTAPSLIARLARALIDPAYKDDNGWVRKGRELFSREEARWADPEISRAIGGLLGNDLGQMRVQFNARTYLVEPVYRDDNFGLWDFGDVVSSSGESDLLYESARFDRVEDDSQPADRERERRDAESASEPPRRAMIVTPSNEEQGIPVARYPEWDYLIGRDRPDWATVTEFVGSMGSPGAIDQILERHSGLVTRITRLIRSAKVSRPVRLHHQPEGDRLDLDACISAAVSCRSHLTPDPHIYMTVTRRDRDLSALVLLDASQSTNDIVRGTDSTVLTLEREATALLAYAMAELGDPFAIHAFCSNGREEVRYFQVKDFEDPFDIIAKRHLSGLTGSLSTRMGIAIRHAGAALARQRTHRRLLLVVTDGEPSDVDVGDRRYLVEDARKAVLSLSHAGIDVFCVGLDAGGDSYLTRIFARRNVLQIDRLEGLPEKLPMLYLRLTA